MEYFYKIPKQVADSIGSNQFDSEGNPIDPFCAEQMNGDYLMNEKTFLDVSTQPQLSNIFNGVTFIKIDETQINLKYTPQK